jgi:regulator of replication initiation timing
MKFENEAWLTQRRAEQKSILTYKVENATFELANENKTLRIDLKKLKAKLEQNKLDNKKMEKKFKK